VRRDRGTRASLCDKVELIEQRSRARRKRAVRQGSDQDPGASDGDLLQLFQGTLAGGDPPEIHTKAKVSLDSHGPNAAEAAHRIVHHRDAERFGRRPVGSSSTERFESKSVVRSQINGATAVQLDRGDTGLRALEQVDVACTEPVSVFRVIEQQQETLTVGGNLKGNHLVGSGNVQEPVDLEGTGAEQFDQVSAPRSRWRRRRFRGWWHVRRRARLAAGVSVSDWVGVLARRRRARVRSRAGVGVGVGAVVGL
jgi:hypothetical protein